MQGCEIMHVLIIPGEELNENNLLSSIFEIHQAQALKDLNVRVGFISTNLNGSIYKEVIQEIKKLDFKFNKSIRIKIQRINEINLVEAYGKYITPSFLNLYRKERTRAGLLAYKNYCTEFGIPDIIHAHSRFLDSVIIANKIFKRYKVPYIFTEHSSFHQREIVTKKEYQIYIQLINNSNRWIVVGESLGKFIIHKLEELRFKINKPFTVVPNILDKNFISSIDVPQKIDSYQNFSFLNVASLDLNKNHALLLESFAEISKRYKNVKLKIAGVGPQIENLLNKKNILGLDNVEFLGGLNRDEVVNEIKQANCFVLSSKIETFGVVLIEAMSIGRPVISTRCGGPNDIVNQQNGILVEPNNIQELANAMCEMINNYSQYNLNAISKSCIENYGPKAIGKKLIQIYQEALN
jgi:glycosyltransferase involved in cell wall biosynthesis